MLEIRRRLDDRLDQQIIDCAAARGIRITPGELPTSPADVPQVEFGGRVRTLRDQNATLFTEATPARSAAEQAAYEECLVSVSDRPDPLNEFFAWLDVKAQEANARADSDPRVIAARKDLSECLHAAGYPVADHGVLARDLYDRASNVVDRLRSGTISATDANRSLDELETEEAAITTAIGPCVDDLLAVEQDVRFEIEQRVLDTNDPAFTEQLDQLNTRLRD